MSFGLKVGPSGSAIQVFVMRGGRVLERVELATDPGGIAGRRCGRSPGGAAAVLRDAVAAGRNRLAVGRSKTPKRWRSGCRRARAGACRCSSRSAATSGRCVELADAQRGAVVSARASTRTALRNFDALETLRSMLGAAGGPAAHRVLRHLDDSGQRDGGVDGRLRGRPDAEERLPQIRFATISARRIPRRIRTISRRCARSSSGGIASSSKTAGRFRT